MKRLIMIAAAVSMVACSADGPWTAAEKDLIGAEGDVMRVLTVDDPADSVVLHTPCLDLPVEALQTPEYAELARKLVATVNQQEGVGIAGPQVGLSRRVIAVQRFDKPGEPFEIYGNVRVVALRGEREYGPEGCLSVPGRRGDVLRWRVIDIQYTSPQTLKDTVETVTGFTSVIFQHECDHLDGILYIDYEATRMQ